MPKAENTLEKKINLTVFQINTLTTLKGKERKKGLLQTIYEQSREREGKVC